MGWFINLWDVLRQQNDCRSLLGQPANVPREFLAWLAELLRDPLGWFPDFHENFLGQATNPYREPRDLPANLHRDPLAWLVDLLRVLLAKLASFLRDFLVQLAGILAWLADLRDLLACLVNIIMVLLAWLADVRDFLAWLADLLFRDVLAWLADLLSNLLARLAGFHRWFLWGLVSFKRLLFPFYGELLCSIPNGLLEQPKALMFFSHM